MRPTNACKETCGNEATEDSEDLKHNIRALRAAMLLLCKRVACGPVVVVAVVAVVVVAVARVRVASV